MSWMAWFAIACGVAAVVCFLRGAFQLSWDALPWLFFSAIAFVAASVFTLCAVFA